jgi:hypothetical protein
LKKTTSIHKEEIINDKEKESTDKSESKSDQIRRSQKKTDTEVDESFYKYAFVDVLTDAEFKSIFFDFSDEKEKERQLENDLTDSERK